MIYYKAILFNSNGIKQMNKSIIDPFILYNIARFANVHILKNLVRASRPFHILVANNCSVKYDLMDCYASAGLLLYSDGRTMIKHGIQNYERMKIYWRNNKKHRDGDLPAIECQDGNNEWWKDDKLYRAGDLPAIVNSNGYKEWWKNDKLHRDGDLPAIVNSDGSQIWFINDVKQQES